MRKRISKAIEDYKKQADMNNALERRWVAMFIELVDFKNMNGHADVPAKYPQNKSLGYWIRRQRLVYDEGTLDLNVTVRPNTYCLLKSGQLVLKQKRCV